MVWSKFDDRNADAVDSHSDIAGGNHPGLSCGIQHV